MFDSPYSEGWEAYESGSFNPYDMEDPQWLEWRSGYSDAREQAKENRLLMRLRRFNDQT